MAQAAKKRKRRKTATKAPQPSGSPWLMLVVGLVCGAVLSGLYFGSKENEPGRFGSGIRSLMENKPEPERTVQAPQPQAAPETEPEVKLDFHDVLPNIDVVISESDIIEYEEPVADRPEQDHVLQVGSYKDEADAESLRAKLALAGFEAVIQRVKIDKGTYFRVRMGPYQSMRKLQLDKKRLAKRGVDTLTIRLETPAEQARQTE